ncbi:MAG: GTP-binding protein, partial [Pseudomonadota bacterium]
RRYIAAHWEEPWGDRRQEIVFIGADIDWSALKAKLDEALVPVAVADGPGDPPDLPDPFPVWRRAEAAA